MDRDVQAKEIDPYRPSLPLNRLRHNWDETEFDDVK